MNHGCRWMLGWRLFFVIAAMSIGSLLGFAQSPSPPSSPSSPASPSSPTTPSQPSPLPPEPTEPATTRYKGAMYRDGRVVREPRYVGPSIEMRWLYPINVNNSWGYANPDGDIAIWMQYQWSDDFYQERARVMVSGRTGFINYGGTVRIAPAFDWADRYRQSQTLVYQNGRFGFLDEHGRWRIEAKYSQALGFSQELAAARMEPTEAIGYVDIHGRWKITPQFSLARSFHHDVAVVRLAERQGEAIQDGPYALIDAYGRTVFVDQERQIQAIGDFSSELARVRIGNRWGFMDIHGKMRIDPIYEDVRDFHGEYAAAKQQGVWGYINQLGTWAVSPAFDQALDFSHDLAAVCRDGKWGFIDPYGRLKIALQFRQVEPFRGELARVWFAEHSMFAYIDSAGRVIWYPIAATDRVREHTAKGQTLFEINGEIPMRRAPSPRLLTSPPYPPYWQDFEFEQLPRPEAWVKLLPKPSHARSDR